MSETSDSSVSSEDSENSEFSEKIENSESSKLTKFSEQIGGGTPDHLHRGGHCYWWVLAYTHTGDFEIETGFRFSLTPHPFALWTGGITFAS